MRDEVLEFLRQNQGSFVSGQDMSEACHVSRTAIWKHIKALRQKGYKIESYTKRGYRLLEEPDLLSPLAMKQILKTDVFGKRYVYMDTTEPWRCICAAAMGCSWPPFRWTPTTV